MLQLKHVGVGAGMCGVSGWLIVGLGGCLNGEGGTAEDLTVG